MEAFVILDNKIVKTELTSVPTGFISDINDYRVRYFREIDGKYGSHIAYSTREKAQEHLDYLLSYYKEQIKKYNEYISYIEGGER